MAKRITACPVCGDMLKIKSLQCPGCDLELRNDFETSVFDRLNGEQYAFLLAFLKHRGNLKLLQEELAISYPYAKKRLEEVLNVLDLHQEEETVFSMPDNEMFSCFPDSEGGKASDMIRKKLMESGGMVTVSSITGKCYTIKANPDGQHFFCRDLPVDFTYAVFDIIVDLLKSQPDGSARKGNARNFKLGDPGCRENTVAGAILKNYFEKQPGESGPDPVFVLAAVLEWAGIASNGRGYLKLSAAYL